MFKILRIVFCVILMIFTLGALSVYVEWDDMRFKYIGWLTCIIHNHKVKKVNNQ